MLADKSRFCLPELDATVKGSLVPNPENSREEYKQENYLGAISFRGSILNLDSIIVIDFPSQVNWGIISVEK